MLTTLFESGDPLVIVATVGTITGAVLGGLVMGPQEIFTSMKKIFTNFTDLGGIFKKIDLSDTFKSSLKSMASDPEKKVMYASFLTLLKKNKDIMKKITGNFDALDDLDKLKVMQLADKMDEVNVDDIQDVLKKLDGDLGKLSKIQMENMLVLAKRRNVNLHADRVAKWDLRGNVDELTNGELDELLLYLDRGESFDALGFRNLQSSNGITIADRVFDLNYSKVISQYPNVDLQHILRGNSADLRKGLHVDSEVVRFFREGKIRVSLDRGVTTLGNQSQIREAINAKRFLYFEDTRLTGNWSAQKSLFKFEDWSLDSIGRATEYLRQNTSRGVIDASRPDLVRIVYNHGGKSYTLEGFKNASGFLESAYILY